MIDNREAKMASVQSNSPRNMEEARKKKKKKTSTLLGTLRNLIPGQAGASLLGGVKKEVKKVAP